MKRVGILTFHMANNFGAVLQTYALSEYLNSMEGIKAEIVNYLSPVMLQRNAQFPFDLRSHQSLKKRIKGIINLCDDRATQKTFDVFRTMYLPLSCPVAKSEIKQLTQQYDTLVCGSDQIWNPVITNFDRSFFLDFANKNQSIFSYAASIGDVSLLFQYEQFFREEFARFKVLSVREHRVGEEIRRIFGYNTREDIDPVFLLGKNKWENLLQTSDGISYILAFKMGVHKSGEDVLQYAKELGHKTGLRVIYLSDREIWYKYRDIEHYGVASPSEFLGLIWNAKYVVTNSFHATAFSLIFNKPFVVNTNIPRAERISDLLMVFELDNNSMQKRIDYNEIDNIDWDIVNHKLNSIIEQSKRYIKDTICSEV